MKHDLILKVLKMLLILAVVFSNQIAFAASPLILEKGEEKYPLGLQVYLLEDKEGKLSLSDVTSQDYQNKFIKSEVETPNYGYTDSVYWVRFTVRNEVSEINKWILELGYANIHFIDFYRPHKDKKGFVEIKTGLSRPVENRDYKYHRFLFNIDLPPGKTETLYIRFQTETSMTIPLTLWSPASFENRKNREYLYFGAFYGILFAMLFYNLILFFSLKLANYFYYVLFLIAFIFFQLAFGGAGPVYIWPSYIEFNNYGTNIFQTLMILSLLKFTISFLELKKFSRILYKLLNFLLIVWFVILILIPLTSYSFITAKADLWMYVSFLCSAATGLYLLIRGYKPSRYFLIAWMGMIIGATVMSGIRFKLFPSNVYTEHGHQIGLTWLIIFWSLALADRMNHLKNKFMKANFSLKRETKLNNKLFQSSPAFIVTIDSEFNILMINDTMCKKLGYRQDEIIGKNYIQTLVPNIYRQTEKEMFESQVVSKEMNINYENYVVSKEGKQYLVDWHGSYILYEEDAGFIIGIGIDITKRKQVEEQLVQAQKMETIGNLAGGIAHDFNNVLSGITGPISIIENILKKKGKIEVKTLQKYLPMMSGSSARAADMIKQLLSISQKQEFSFSPVDLNDAIKNVMGICASTLDKSIQLNPEYYSSPVMINADHTQIEQVLLNFCVNAGHAMTMMRNSGEKWGGILTVSVDPVKADKYLKLAHPEAEKDNYWRLSVSDTGVGIGKDILTRIFDPFFTTKSEGKGTGLGLSMVYNIIKQHDGFINVYSEPGKGATFSIYLPVPEAETVSGPEKVDETIFRGEGKILVVDDEEIIRITAKDILETCGYEAVLAANGIDAVAIYKSEYEEIRCVLLDMSMPGMSGREVYIEMKKINPDVKVLLVSGFRQDERVEEVLKLGVMGFVQKPFTLEELSGKVYELTGNI